MTKRGRAQTFFGEQFLSLRLAPSGLILSLGKFACHYGLRAGLAAPAGGARQLHRARRVNQPRAMESHDERGHGNL